MKFLSTGFSLLLSLTSVSVFANNYTLSIENGGTVDPTLEVGNIVDLALDSPDINQMIWGNVQIEYDPTVLEAQYVDETAIFYGFFTYWTHAPANGAVCGGGMPYYYTTGGGSDRANVYAARYGEGSGPSAYIDHVNGTIRFYHGNYLYTGYYEPLRLGFKVLKTGTTTITVRSETETTYDWCNFDTVTPTNFTFGQL
ncbi:MAG TPA: hypothetical protein ENI94_14575 [Gammaproteobacteria bacterium]|nr:hypothetical protein [Gammaproteobacteria bacterium]